MRGKYLYRHKFTLWAIVMSMLVWSLAGCGQSPNDFTVSKEAGEEQKTADSEGSLWEQKEGEAAHSASLTQTGANGLSEKDGKQSQGAGAGKEPEGSAGGASGTEALGGGVGAEQGTASMAGTAGEGTRPYGGNASAGTGTKPSEGTAGITQGVKSPEGAGGTSQGTKRDDGSVVTAQGALAVDGTQLVDASGNPVQLRGISTHGLSWYPDYVNLECFRQLKEEWGANVIRLAMYTAENGGYCTGGDQESLKELVKSGVEYAVETGLYVIIDWHILSDGNPKTYLAQAKEFFAEMSDLYKDYTNVLYEICNEPNGGTSWSDVKQYAEEVIEVIRENDEDGIILVGTPNWSQYVDQAAADPIEGYDNIMYTLHYYAATHTDSLRNTMVKAVEGGLPVFVSEYGICDASGNGAIDKVQANQWVETLDQLKISYVAWNLSNKAETSALFKSSCSKVNGFTTDDLSESGKWLYEVLSSGDAKTSSAENGSTQGNDSGDQNNTSDSGQGNAAENQGNTPGNQQESQGNTSGAAQENQSNMPGGGQGNVPGSQEPDSIQSDGGNTSAGANGLDISAEVINSWGQGNDTYYQYTLTLANQTGTERNGWKISIVFSDTIALNGGWNGNYQVDGNVLTISSMDYNGVIAVEGSLENIGFILQSVENLTVLEAYEL